MQGAGQARCGQVWEEGASKVEVTDGRSVAVQVFNVHAPFCQALDRFDWLDLLGGLLRWMRLNEGMDDCETSTATDCLTD